MQKNKSTSQGRGNGAPPKLLFVISDLQVGGTERQVAALAPALVKLGWAVTIYSFADGELLRGQLERNGVRVILIPGRLGLLHPSRIMRVFYVSVGAIHFFWTVLRLRPKIVHCFLPAGYLIGAPVALLARVPVRIMSRRSLNFYQRNGFIRYVERKLHQLMNAILGNSRSVVNQLRDEGVRPDQLGLIYNGIDFEAFATLESRAEHRDRLGILPTALIICIVANLIPYKGHRDLIAALGLAAPNLPAEWRLLIVGRDDGIGGGLMDQAAQLGLKDYVLFFGPRNDIAAIMAASDIGILCSHQEGFSNAILEAMACGLPMIVSDVGGNAEAVVNEQTGLVVPARDVQRLADAIVRLSGDRALRAQFGTAGRQRAIDRFGVQRFVQSHHKLYQALLEGKSANDVADIRVSSRNGAKLQEPDSLR
jgi:glycosyltransferase involved in cell wall biosynthesis